MNLLHFYRAPGVSPFQEYNLLQKARKHVSPYIQKIETEACFNIQTEGSIKLDGQRILTWLLRETFEANQFSQNSTLTSNGTLLEVGPRMSFTTSWSTNATSICHTCGLKQIQRIERSRRYLIQPCLNQTQLDTFLAIVHDRMTECHYPKPLSTFETGIKPEPTFEIPIIQEGRSALERINQKMGLAFDEFDLDYYTDLFLNYIQRNPTNVECFDIAQSNSEHSRHWFFNGRLIIDNLEVPNHLMALIKAPLEANPNNSLIAFKDNSSSICGYTIKTIIPKHPGEPSPFVLKDFDYNIIFTAETHNFPSGVAPFPGAETGTGGRIRDIQSTGRGALVIAGTAAYCVGNLNIPGYDLPWESDGFSYPKDMASPLQIEIEASNGASDYGNKFGEPVVLGYTRSFGLRLPSGERREWIKPIMFSGGIGQMDHRHTEKNNPEKNMWIVKIGGPAYRIGMGGGAASSLIQGENLAELDFNAVQRGDAEMEQKINRVIRSCVELGEGNPILSIHDQGAGGNCNVLKEIVEPAGARINVRSIPVGDNSLSILEIWGAEYQEQNALLLWPKNTDLFKNLCHREKVPVAFVGRITGDGQVVLYDERDRSTPVNLNLNKVLGNIPQKTFKLDHTTSSLRPIQLPPCLTVSSALERVHHFLSVGSKRFLTTKVDRSVTGLVAQQQCVGPLQLTVSNVAVIAQSHFGLTGMATAIGEQPIKGLVNPSAMARMSLAEALTNLVWALVSDFEDIKCSGNWMWAAKLQGEGANLYDAVIALTKLLTKLGIAIDGGKDSLSMATFVSDGTEKDETVKAPGALVVSAYVPSPDITKTITPDLKLPGTGNILYVDLSGNRNRLGGSALAQAFKQIGDESPDVDDPELLKCAFKVLQDLISSNAITAGHDRSDGGLITTILEMAFAGNCGIEINLPGNSSNPFPSLFSEELGFVLEVSPKLKPFVLKSFQNKGIPCLDIGKSDSGKKVKICIDRQPVLEGDIRDLRHIWEETSYQLDLLQANPNCVNQERNGLKERTGPNFILPFTPKKTAQTLLDAKNKPRVAIVREEGSNGDREMTSAFYAAGFEPWDVTITDLLNGKIDLNTFKGAAFVGGFSYADVLDSGKGWAAAIKFNPTLWEQFQNFYHRPDTFSFGVCNGCQLLALIGWIPWQRINNKNQPRFIHNSSGRFESRFVTVQIQKSPAILLQGMENAVLGVWAAHAEGRFFFPDLNIFHRIKQEGLAPIRYLDDNNQITESYPLNPNGSPEGIAAICSPDGRHLAMMPHPERTFLKWQWGWMPESWKQDLEASPWIKMFQNAREWCSI